MRTPIFLVGLIILLIILSGCIVKTYQVKLPCENCTRDLKEWKQCLPMCKDIDSKHEFKTDKIPAEWQLSYVGKSISSQTTLNGETNNTVNYNCRFQQLSHEQKVQATELFGKD